MENELKIATWNICLGLINKKDTVTEILKREMIDICCLQEVDIPPDYDTNILTSKNYELLVEKNVYKSRTAFYIRNGIKYSRRMELEGINSGMIVLDLDLQKKYRMIGIYRVFNPPGATTQRAYFSNQINLIRTAITGFSNSNLIILGDFNLNESMRYSQDYSHKEYFLEMMNLFDPMGLVQMVEFETWKRLINGTWRTSTIDHVYTNDATVIKNLKPVETIIGDHVLVTMNLKNEKKEEQELSYRRDWSKYSKEKLIEHLSSQDLTLEIDDVQSLWNRIETIMVDTTDELVPIRSFQNNVSTQSQTLPVVMKRKLALRKRLLNSMKRNPDDELKKRLKQLNAEIKNHYRMNKRMRVRKGIIPGNTKSLWKAVKVAKDTNVEDIPSKMFKGDMEIETDQISDCFADYFCEKITLLSNDAQINPTVYNGRRKMDVIDENFMTEENIIRAVKSIKIKNSEGNDRIPQRILIDGISCLIKPLANLFNKIYTKKEIPEQWKLSKVTPVHKKGDKSRIANYRPVANLCAASKIYERLILQRIQDLEDEKGMDLTGINQHGFKRGKSTTTASLAIQSALARALDVGEYALLAGLDLSSAFDMVNVNLLIKRMRIVGLPHDVIKLIEIWLKGRSFYVEVKGRSSFNKMSELGIVQGSILGPFLYALFVSPLFDVTPFFAFADDKQVLDSNVNLAALINSMETKLEIMTKWLRDSGLVVNDEKTEICLFHKQDHATVNVRVNNKLVKSKRTINILGVLFDSKLQWNDQVAQSIRKSKQALHALRLVNKYMTKTEMKILLTANFYSTLYYNCEVWLIPTLSPILKQQLLSASANGLRILGGMNDERISFEQLHRLHKRATPTNMMKHRMSIQLYKIYNGTMDGEDWMDLNLQQNFNLRINTVQIFDKSRLRIGRNIMMNRLPVLNNEIPFDWLNLSLNSFKMKTKTKFMIN